MSPRRRGSRSYEAITRERTKHDDAPPASTKVAAMPSYGVVDVFAAARRAFVFVLW